MGIGYWLLVIGYWLLGVGWFVDLGLFEVGRATARVARTLSAGESF
jgi:hypothetical protein